MHGEDLSVDESREGEIVEYFSTVPPDIYRTVFSHALVVKSVTLGDLSALVVATNQRDPIRVLYLRSKLRNTSNGIWQLMKRIKVTLRARRYKKVSTLLFPLST